MKKVIFSELLMLVLLALVMFVLLYKKEPADIPLSQISERFESEYSLQGMEKVSSMRFKRAFGLNDADYREVLYYTPDNTMSVNEFLIVKLNTKEQAETVREGISARIASQKTSFDGYGTNQTELLSHAVIYENGNYVCLFISEQADAWCELVKHELEGRK